MPEDCLEHMTFRLPIALFGRMIAGVLFVLFLGSPTPMAFAQATTYNFVGVWSASGSYKVNDVVTYGGSMYADTVATAPVVTTTGSGGLTNYFDQSSIVANQVVLVANGQLASILGFQSSGFVNVAGASSFVTNILVGIFDPYGMAFYDSKKNFLNGTELTGNGFFNPGVPIAVPSGAAYVRFWWQTGNMGTTAGAAVLDLGTVLQTSYTPFGVATSGSTVTTTIPTAAPTDTTHWAVYTNAATPAAPVSSTNGPWAGKKIFVLGDSIVANDQPVVGQIATALGAVVSSSGATAPGIDALGGRTMGTYLNGQTSSGIISPLSASVLADVDLLVIALGTNQDSPYGLGSVTDAPSLSGTMSAQMRSMLETILSWKPGMRIIVVGPYQTNRYNLPAGVDGLLGKYDYPGSVGNAASVAVLRNIDTQMKAVCNLYAIPYVDMFNESGVNFSTSALWLRDGLHPSSVGYGAFYVPYIVAQLNRISQ